MVHTNAPWCGSGYGVQGGYLARILGEIGLERAISASFGLEGNVLNYDGALVIPGYHGTDPHGVKRGPLNGKLWGADVFLTLLDAWIFDGRFMREAGQRWVALAPIDHEPMPGRVRERLREAWWPAAICRHGWDAMVEAGLTGPGGAEPLYLPHTFDPEVYRPLTEDARRVARTALKLPADGFVVGMVAANKGQPSRKSIPAVVEAFAELHRKHPGEVTLALHMEMDSRHAGVNVASCLSYFGVPESAVRFSDQNAPSQKPEHMAALFGCLDLLANPSMGEGFGVTILEAAACGTPALVGGWTSMPEVAGPAGIVLDRAGALRWWTIQESFQWLASPGAILEGMELALSEHGTSSALERRELAHRHAQAWALPAVREIHAAEWAKVAEAVAAEDLEAEAAPVVEVRT